jgi:GT2 family glycosyltransferase
VEPDLTVVVLSWNTRDLTLCALRAVPAAAAPFAARSVCVDNGSADGTAEAVASEVPEAVVVENGANLGYAAGNDAALPHLAGRAVAFLNSDAEPSPGSLAAALRYLDEHPRVGVVSPPLVGHDGQPQRAAWGYPTIGSLLHQYTPAGWVGIGRSATRRARGRRGVADDGGPAEAVAGVCLVVRRDLCERLGGFDPGYPFYVEDVDLCWRARAAGYEVHVVADAPPVRHRGGAATRLADGAMRLPLLQGALRFTRKRSSSTAFAAFWVAFQTGVVMRSAWELFRAPFVAAGRRLRGRPERAQRAWRMAAERRRFLERDLLTLLRSHGGPARLPGVAAPSPAARPVP